MWKKITMNVQLLYVDLMSFSHAARLLKLGPTTQSETHQSRD